MKLSSSYSRVAADREFPSNWEEYQSLPSVYKILIQSGSMPGHYKDKITFERDLLISAYLYARDVVKGRWPEAEPSIVKDLQWAFPYARDVIQGRWPEAEPTILKSPWAGSYRSFLRSKEK